MPGVMRLAGGKRAVLVRVRIVRSGAVCERLDEQSCWLTVGNRWLRPRVQSQLLLRPSRQDRQASRITQALPILLTCLSTEILKTSKLEGKGALLNINENDTGSFNESIGDASLMNYFLMGGNSKRLPFSMDLNELMLFSAAILM